MTPNTPQPPSAQGPANGQPRSADAEVMTLAEAAAFLRVPEVGLREDADAGRLPGRLIAGEWRFVKGALLNWLANAAGDRSSVPGEGGPPGVIIKSIPAPRDLNRGFLDSIGAFADDPTLEPMIEQIYRDRKRKPIGE